MKKTESDGLDLGDLDRLIEEITVDANGDDGKLWAFRQASSRITPSIFTCRLARCPRTVPPRVSR